MGKNLILFLLLLVNVNLASGQSGYLWPLEGVEPGQGIISSPQGYIGDEFNFGALFLTAPEKTTVVSPFDGVITSLSVVYDETLHRSYSYCFRNSFDESIEYCKKELDENKDPKYLHGSISIRSDDGHFMHISGLKGKHLFNSGQRVTKGEPIGEIGYAYAKFEEPNIQIEGGDPMTPFGIKSTYVAPKEIKPVLFLSQEEAKEDFNIFIDSIRELYPGLSNLLTEEELRDYVNHTHILLDSYEGIIGIEEFRKIMFGALVKIHDSHIDMMVPPSHPWPTHKYSPRIHLGKINGKLICTNAQQGYGHFIGKEISAVNEIPALQALEIMASDNVGYDGDVESFGDYYLATTAFHRLFEPPVGDGTYDMVIEFADGEKAAIQGSPKGSGKRFVNEWLTFRRINRREEGYELKILDENSAYIGLSTFRLNDVQLEKIEEFIQDISNYENLIIDLRNNFGGNPHVMDRLYSYIAEDSLQLDGYLKVNKKDTFDSFKYSLNYTGISGLFKDFTEEKDGYYLRTNSTNVVKPHESVNYKGKVYVLINEFSSSASTVFPAYVVRSHRGVIVGRETRGAYHFMNAMNFADIRLPNSRFVFKIPLVAIIFDTVVNERVPYERGILPDYEVPLTLEELSFEKGDVILNHTLELIKEGKYLKGQNPFLIKDNGNSDCEYNRFLMVLGSGILVGCSIIYTFAIKKRR